MIDELTLSEAQAEVIIEQAIDFGVFTDDMPDSKKDKLEAAHEVVAFAIDSWVSDGIKPSNKKADAAAVEQIEAIFENAGVTIDEDDEITYGDPPSADDEDDDEEDAKDDGEVVFDINDVIEGYDELTAASRVKAIKKLDLDPDDDDDYNTLVGIEEWEKENDNTSRVLMLIEELIPAEEGDDEGDDEDEKADEAGDAAEAEAEDDEDEDSEEAEEPWEDYDTSKLADIKEVLDDDDRTVEECEYVLEYEEAKDKPRAAIVKAIKARIAELSEDDSDDDEEGDGEEAELPSEKDLMKLDKADLKVFADQYEVDFPVRFTEAGKKRVVKALLAADAGEEEADDEPEEKPARKGRAAAKTADPDDSDDVDEAVARDDAKDAKKAKSKTIELTREQIIEVMTTGAVTL